MYIFEGFMIGLVGSLHCIGMCGPLVLALPFSHAAAGKRVFGGLVYNLGRAITYAGFGVLFGIVGKTFQIWGLLSGLSVAFGIILIMSAFIPGIVHISPVLGKITAPFSSWLKQKMGAMLRQKNIVPLFVFGLLNGLLPCGLVYGAIMGAIVAGTPAKSSLFMFLFGLGTLPLMFLLIFFSDIIKNRWMNYLRKIIPVFIIILGILFILRGLNLGIPFLSPSGEKVQMMLEKKSPNENETPACCH